MKFTDVLGHEHIKNHLKKSADLGRIPHAQLFVGKEGSGTLPMALAYAQYVLAISNNNAELVNLKCNKLMHPDMHFAFPVATTDKVKKDPVSNFFLNEWREFITLNAYGNLFDWLQFIGIENKQGKIGTDEALEIIKALKLKSFEGGYKVMLIWMAEKMNTSASNKLLKLIEEPPEKTVFLLITEDEESIISTIRSRCQIIHFSQLPENEIVNGLISRKNLDIQTANYIAQQAEGNFNKALQLISKGDAIDQFEQWFIEWVRAAFKAKTDVSVISQLIDWSEEISKSGRETQKQFLEYCLQFFRQALLVNYNSNELVYLQPKTTNFKLEKFAPFVHSANIVQITQEIDEAIYHIEGNGAAKTILLDLSIKLTRLLHQKETE